MKRKMEIRSKAGWLDGMEWTGRNGMDWMEWSGLDNMEWTGWNGMAGMARLSD